MLTRYFKDKSRQVKQTWLKVVLRAIPTLLWVNIAILGATILLWFTGLYFGDGNAFRISYYWHAEWTFVGFVIAFGIHFGKKIVDKKSPPALWRLAIGVIAASILGGMFIDLFYQLVGPLLGITFNMSITYYDIILPVYITNSITYLFWGIVVSIPVTIHYNARYKHELENRLKQLEKEKLEQLKDKAVLDALRAKINPHFLYNSLNSIASLVKSHPEKAEEMTLNLSELFRLSIGRQEGHFSTVAEEINLVQLYLSIEKIRFADQLTYEIEIEPDCMDRKIPRFIIQPIVENAIKHGTSKVENGKLLAKIYNENGWLAIDIADNGPEFTAQPQSGHGLLGVQEKLDTLYHGDFRFEWVNHPEKMVQIRINKSSDA